MISFLNAILFNILAQTYNEQPNCLIGHLHTTDIEKK